MALSDGDKAALLSVFEELKSQFADIGCEAMESLFKDHPDTKSHFSHMDVTSGSKDLKTHGEKIMNAIHDSLKNHDKLHDNLANLREMHTNKLRLRVEDIKLLCTCLVVIIVKHSPKVDQCACDKFLHGVAVNLIAT